MNLGKTLPWYKVASQVMLSMEIKETGQTSKHCYNECIDHGDEIIHDLSIFAMQTI